MMRQANHERPRWLAGIHQVKLSPPVTKFFLGVAAERRLIERADELVLLVDSSKFKGSSGHVVCGLNQVDVVVTDRGIQAREVSMLEKAGIKVVIAQ